MPSGKYLAWAAVVAVVVNLGMARYHASKG